MLPLLSIEQVSVRFGGIRALHEISFDVREGSIAGLIGPNGAGKSTLFNCISRLYTPSSGRILLRGQPLAGLPVHGIAGMGIGRTFQNLAIFQSMSVLQNVMVGRHSVERGGFMSCGLGLGSHRRGEQASRARARELLELVDLGAVADQPAAALPFALQKRMEIARALAGTPTLLLLDEPAAGLNHDEIAALASLIRKLRDEMKVTVVLVEHHMGLVMSLCDHLVVLNFGEKIAEGAPADVARDPLVVGAYLGETAPMPVEAAAG